MPSHLSLLILPGLPYPATAETIEAAHGKTISSVLSKFHSRLKNGPSHKSQRLDIVVATSTSIAPEVSHFDHWQSIVALLYQTICAKATQQALDLDTESGLDIRIFILDITSNPQEETGKVASKTEVKQGPIIDVRTLALCGRGYSPIFSVESEQGEEILQRLLHHLPPREPHPPIEHVPGGTILHHGATSPTPQQQHHHDHHSTHTSVAVGGTFDHLHIGHKLLLFGTALALSSPSTSTSSSSPAPPPSTNNTTKHITIGLTADALLVNKKYASLLESWTTRQSRVADFLESILIFSTQPQPPPTSSSSIISNIFHFPSSPPSSSRSDPPSLLISYHPLHDPFGPTITDPDITALVISGETRAGGAAVNKKRVEEKGWNALEILEVDVLDGRAANVASGGGGQQQEGGQEQEKEFASKISSTEIRRRIFEAGGGGDQGEGGG